MWRTTLWLGGATETLHPEEFLLWGRTKDLPEAAFTAHLKTAPVLPALVILCLPRQRSVGRLIGTSREGISQRLIGTWRGRVSQRLESCQTTCQRNTAQEMLSMTCGQMVFLWWRETKEIKHEPPALHSC